MLVTIELGELVEKEPWLISHEFTISGLLGHELVVLGSIDDNPLIHLVN